VSRRRLHAAAIGAAIGTALTTIGLASGALPGFATSGTTGLAAPARTEIVRLLHHDQQGIVLAHQAEAQSTSQATRTRAAMLAADHRRQADTLTRLLDRRRVPDRRRLLAPSAARADRDAAVPAMACDLMPDDAVSRLAAAPAAAFEAEFTSLMERHLVGGALMARRALALGELSPADRAAVRASQARLRA
jgi:hypothetical protein